MSKQTRLAQTLSVLAASFLVCDAVLWSPIGERGGWLSH
jgi:hypothetical protein